ncbi:MAG TPA: hypothetical protein VNN10_03215 [Dehalococcoidia bacterium]|nr:hypothetical protein [Dehalococcoidia bacterium]
MQFEELFGEATLKTLALATAEDARLHLVAGHPLRAAFSAAHSFQIAGQRSWSEDDQSRMERALKDEVKARLRSGDDTTAAWRAGYLILLGARPEWQEEDLRRMVRAVSPRGSVRAWTRMWFAGQAADYLLLTGTTFWTPEDLRRMLDAVREDFALRLRNGDKLMAADRVVLYKVLAAGQADEASA